jgi:macrolide transport system ATP-binding/permease protein
MLGIIIGISSVVAIVALGTGSREGLREQLSGFGTNTIEVLPGEGFGDRRAWLVQTLTIADADALEQLDYVDGVTPGYSTSVTLRHASVDVTGSVSGVGEKYFRVHGKKFAAGRAFDLDSVRQQSQVAVIDDNTRKAMFKDGQSPLGQVILLGSVPVRIIGVTAKDEGLFSNGETLEVWIPYTTATTRLIGQQPLRNINVRVKDTVSMDAAEQGISRLMTQRHAKKDFFLFRTDSIRKQTDTVTGAITLLVSSIALISLLVGGIGVMNIMLVSVTERTQEIGVRMAVGARQGDILRQFLIEAVLVCLIGGALGVGLALFAGMVFNSLDVGIKMIFSTASIVGAFAVSSTIGIVFGFVPARNAARLDPVNALARE